MTKLTRVVHSSSSAFFGPAAELLPDLAPMLAGPVDHVLLFTDADSQEAHGFLMSEDDAKSLARTMLGLKIATVVPRANGANGEG